jgi:fibronectin-binding autotransporter adhesin
MSASRRKKALVVAAVAHAALVIVAPARGADWSLTTGGSWATAGNWSTATVPDGDGVAANFTAINTANRTITLDSGPTGFTVSTLTFDMTPSTAFTNVISVGSPTTSALKFGIGATITTSGTGTGNNTISAPMVLNDTVTAIVNQTTQASTAGSLNMTGTMSGTGGFIKQGPGLMTFGTGGKTYTGATVFDTDSSRTRMSQLARPSATSSMTLKAGSQLDLIAGGTYGFGTGPLNLNGIGPTTGTFSAFPGVLRPDTNLAITISNPVVLQSDSLVHVQGSATGAVSFSGVVSGPGVLTFTATNSDNNLGSLVLTNSANTYTGGTVVNGGTFDVSASMPGATTGPLTVNVVAFGGAQTTVKLNTTSPTTTGSLSGTVGAGAAGATINNGGQLYTANQTTDGTYGGIMVGAGGFALGALSTNTLTLTGANAYTGQTSVAAGKLSLVSNLTTSSSATVTGGTLELPAGGGSLRVLKTPSVSVSGTGRLDIQDNKIVTASPVGAWTGANYTGVTGLIKSGRNGGGWGGSGIVTSQTQAVTSNITGIGVASASQVKGIAATDTAVFAGQTVSGSDTLAMYTYGGDANLDGKINVDDYTRIDFNVPLGNPGWYNGDFNYDGKINVDDYTIIDFNVGIQGAQFPTSVGSGLSGVSAVPEPASVAVLGLAAVSLIGRRRRSK